MNARRLALLLGIIVLVSTIIVTPALSATSASIAIFPLSVVTEFGTVIGATSTLAALEQNGSDDNPATYVTFQTPSTPYFGYSTFQLPASVRPDRISSTLLQVNFKGPAHSQQIWSWEVYNWVTKQWINVGDTIGTNANVWNTLLFPLPSGSGYFSSVGEIRVRLTSDNANGDAKLDYEALHFTYLPITPAATRPTSTTISTKPGYVFADTYTPTITLSPTITPSKTSTNTSTPTRTATATPTPTATSSPLPMPTINITEFKSGFTRPLYIAHANDGTGRIFVIEQCGKVRIVDNTGNVLATPFLDISTMSGFNCASSEQGLLSIAFPPQYASKNYFYAAYTIDNGSLRVSRFHVPLITPNNADENEMDNIITIPHPNESNHNGGQLAFGSDGYLYISTGDGGGAGDQNNNAQNKDVLLGKILRIDVESGSNTYNIPASNPFVGVSGLDEIWALGLRNPWRFSFDRLTHHLYIADVGQGAWEEVDFQSSSSEGGENYGWHCYEGNHAYNTANCQAQDFYEAPVTEYSHSLGCSVTGGYVYRASEYPSLQGIYLYGDYCSGRIWGLKNLNNQWQNQLLLDTDHKISSFGEDEAGNVYFANISTGVIYKIVVP